MGKVLLLIVGPTGVGKTELSIRLAEQYGCPVVSCDSRQIFREIPVGTAAPTQEEQKRVPHFFVASRFLNENYNAGMYERDALALLDRLFQNHNIVLMTGGSMLYASAVCYGLDNLPSVPEKIRKQVQWDKTKCSREEWLRWLQSEVQRLDPEYWKIVDHCNPARLAHCVEMCLTTDKPYSTLRSGKRKQRPFNVLKIGIDRPREELYERINRRVEKMIDNGLVEEARKVWPLRHLNSLQTVGYKELFAFFDGEYDLTRAVELIQQNTRHYAKRQMTWFRRDEDIHWLNANDSYEKNLHSIDCLLAAVGMQKD